MVSKLTNEHYEMIKAFSRKITKGVNSDDLSQHVILKLLQKDKQFINGLIDREEFKYFIWRFTQNMIKYDHSSYNREVYGTHDIMQRPINLWLDGLIDSHQHDENTKEDASITYRNKKVYLGNALNSFDSIFAYEEEEEIKIELEDVLDKAGLTDIERMYLNAYKDANCNYTTCSSNLDISTSTISKYVKQAIEKCKNSQ